MAMKSLTPLKRGKSIKVISNEHPMTSLRKAVNQLFDDFFMSYELMPLTAFEELCIFNPKVNMSDDGQSITVTAELPGMNHDEIEVWLDRDTLIIQGHKKEGSERTDMDSYCLERVYGDFKRVIPLPQGMDVTHIQATYQKGILKIILPRRTKANPQKRITIKSMR